MHNIYNIRDKIFVTTLWIMMNINFPRSKRRIEKDQSVSLIISNAILISNVIESHPYPPPSLISNNVYAKIWIFIRDLIIKRRKKACDNRTSNVERSEEDSFRFVSSQRERERVGAWRKVDRSNSRFL